MPKRPRKSKKNLQRRAIDDPRLTLDDLAKGAGRQRVTMEKYRELKVTMPAAVRKKLAAFLEKHARHLKAIAEELKRDAE